MKIDNDFTRLSRDEKLNLYRLMWRIRHFEEMIKVLYKKNMIRGSTHVYIGEEVIAVGSCAVLRKDDYITSTHRGHGHCIAKGGDIFKMMAELLGKATGYCKGKGGSMHIADVELGILGANGIVGGGIPLATGAGLSISYLNEDRVCVCFFGDAASHQGSFHESVNMAAVWRLPVIYLCENNFYGVSTHISEATAVDRLSKRAEGYGIPGVTIDGNDVEAVYNAVSEACRRARKGEGPTLIEAITYRWEGHFVGDPCLYREKEEVDKWKEQDPIKRYGEKLLSAGICDARLLKKIEEEEAEAIKTAVDFAVNSPEPDHSELKKDLFAGEEEP